MNCDCAEKISLLIDGELPVVEARELERHLAGCSECQALRADFLSLRQKISAYEPTVNPFLQQQALNKILRGADQPCPVQVSRSRRFGFQWNPGRAALAFASLLLIALVIGIVAYRSVTLKKATSESARSAQPKVTVPVPSPVNQPVANDERGVKQVAGVSTKAAQPSKRPASKRDLQGPVAANVVAANRPTPAADSLPRVRSADAETMTAMHFEKSELLLRAFRNVRLDEPGVAVEVGYERRKAQQLVYQNMILRREADASGDVQIATLLENLEPILIDIANLPDQPVDDDIRVIKERVERKNIVALLQVNSAALARALD